MGDTSHLERMGRELKCPICLSLFTSAVSLSCNHVFCNECIVKSMKVDATCPVCKIPYHRREIRGAPHMDSLVSIYKSMEDASGVNLFVSQNKHSPSGKGKLVRDDSVKKGKKSKGKESRNKKEIDVDAHGLLVMKPSSQTKKRVQLQRTLSSESLTERTEADGIAEKLKVYTDNTVISLDEKSKEGNLSPFFWLRDEDDLESLSELRESDQLSDITPVDVPSFSDLKDSDHEGASKGDEQEKPNPKDMYDSEMFEWTQRPCSPEILPSPVKAKVQGSGGEIDHTPRELSKEASPKIKKRKAGSARKKVARQHVGEAQENNSESLAGANVGEKLDCHGTSGTGVRREVNPDETVKAKRIIRSKGQSSRVQLGISIVKEANGKQGKKRKRCSVKPSPAHTIAASNEVLVGTETANQDRSHGSSDTQPVKQSPIESCPLKKRARRCSAKSLLKDVSGTTQKKTSVKKTKLDSCVISSETTQLHGSDIPTKELNPLGGKQDSSNKKKCTVDRGNCTTQALKKCSTINKSSLGDTALLQQCDRPAAQKFTCAFCQSSEETEASGEMAHYHKGEPVSADFSGATKVIHVHKNCAEWAPNVYFDKHTVVNLDEELTRSRRISCSGCGLKGAALGCYNQSCKSSFHVTCAKLIPECRWDTKNFVMLCPLDASSKLPCEETSRGGKRKRAPKEPQSAESNQVAGKANITELQSKRLSGSPKSLVLCCSGLTDEEKTVVTEFTELCGVTVSRKWDSSVTHVIASINENGACKRTLKFMMGILEGKWILSIDWIKACMKGTEYVGEEPYEISMDVHGIAQGPYLGRQRALNKKPKLFSGLKFYIMGDFEISYRGYLQELIVAAGGTILRRRPISNDNDEEDSTIVVFSVEPSKNNKTLTQRRSDAEALAKSTRARAASSSWVLDSIAGCQILDLGPVRLII